MTLLRDQEAALTTATASPEQIVRMSRRRLIALGYAIEYDGDEVDGPMLDALNAFLRRNKHPAVSCLTSEAIWMLAMAVAPEAVNPLDQFVLVDSYIRGHRRIANLRKRSRGREAAWKILRRLGVPRTRKPR